MRRFLFLALAVPLVVAGRSVADDGAKAIIAKAVEAAGGKDNLEKFKASKTKGKGVISFGGMDLEFTAETAAQLPDKFKISLKIDFAGQNVSVVQTINGDKATTSVNGNSVPSDESQAASLKASILQQKILQITPLLEKGFELKVIPGVKVGDKETVGISVTGKDIKEVKLFFDKSTHLLAKVERMGKVPMNDDEQKQEVFLTEYKEVQGMKRPTKTVVISDGKKFMETTILEQKYLEKLDDKEFND